MSLTLVSLFDGIGGFPLAFSRAGVKTVATVEIDPAAASVTARHFPDAQHFDDVTRVTADDFRAAGFVPDRGIVTAGWPCQDFSVAGRRAGLAGARSGLWWEVQRLLAESRPRWFVGENVPGLLSSVCEPECDGGCMAVHGGAMGSVLGSLAELGYGVAYRILDAQFFGVPQQRRRVVIVGHLGVPFGAAAQVLLEPESGCGDSAQGWEAGPDVAHGIARGAGGAGRDVAPTLVARYGKGTDSDASDALIISTEHTHTHTTGPVSTLQGGGKRGYRIDAESAAGGHLQVVREVVSALTTSYCGGIGGVDDNAAQAGYVVVQPTTVTVVRRLTELECERLQGYPDQWTEGQSGSARYRELGNSIAVPVFEWVAHRIVAVDNEIHGEDT